MPPLPDQIQQRPGHPRFRQDWRLPKPTVLKSVSIDGDAFHKAFDQ